MTYDHLCLHSHTNSPIRLEVPNDSLILVQLKPKK